MAQDLSTGTTVTNTFEPNTNPTDAAKTGLVFAGRTLPTNNLIILPQSNTPMPNLYVPFELPAYKNGNSALVALAQMGFQYQLGQSFDSSFVEPSSVTSNTITGLVTLEWNDPLMGIQDLLGESPIGTATQGSANGTIVSVYIEDNQSFMVVAPTTGSAAFTTTAPVVIAAELASPFPDPANSDEVCVAAFSFYNQYESSPVFATSPNLWISVYVTGRDSSISPTGTAIPLVAPTAVTEQPDGSYNLTYPITAAQLGLLPTTYLGNTVVTQATSLATGTYNGYTLTSTTCVINVVNVTGTFVTADTISIVLDISQNGGVLTGKNEISSFGIGYPISNITQLTTTYSDFNSVIVGFQAPNASESNKFNVQGYYSYIAPTINAIPLAQLTTPNVTYYKATAKLDVPTALQYPCNAMMLTMVSMYNDLNNEVPYNASSGEGAILAVTVSSNKVTWPNDFALNQLANQGWTAVGISSTEQCYIFRNQCTLQSISGIVDNEYRFEELQQKVRWLDRNAVLEAEATATLPNGMRANNSPVLIESMDTNMKNLLQSGYDLNMLGNTNNSVTIGQASATRLSIGLTTTIVGANSGNDINVTITPFQIATA